MKRIVSVWLPFLATDRLCRSGGWDKQRPLVTATAATQRHLVAVNRAALRAGLKPGMTVADAQAVVPFLQLAPADPQGERSLLERLAEGCLCYTPWAVADPWTDSLDGGGLVLDIGGCAHLMGGEEALLDDLLGRLRRLGFTARAAVADTTGAAWAWARFGAADRPCLPPGRPAVALAALPVTALRLPPATTTALIRLGLRWIGQVAALPRPSVAARFGRMVGLRLDQALGDQDEPLSPRQPPEVPQVHASFAEAIARAEDVAAATRFLLDRLAALLEPRRLGVRRLEVAAFRLDASTVRLFIGTSRPSRDPRHLFRLLAEPLSDLDAGFGIETLRLAAVETGPLEAAQAALGAGMAAASEEGLALLVDSLGNRLGFDRVFSFAARQSHLPERAVEAVAAGAPDIKDGGAAPASRPAWPQARRPVRLLARPEAVDAVAPVPDAPPLLFRWRRRIHRIRHAEGPERLAAEWWRNDQPDRDYYWVEDEAGRRFWLYREGLYGGALPPRWFLHGIFA
jgi:protein ImuB